MGFRTPEEAKAYNAEWYKKNKERVLERNRKWLKDNPDKKRDQATRYFAADASRKEKASARSRKWYYANLERARATSRASAAAARQDPDKRRTINMRKRAGGAGLTAEEFDSLFRSQGCRCAICRSDDPGSVGWNVDHCHASRRVRFILCAHCNRGLGAFKDNPDLMRRAADILERFQKGESRDNLICSKHPQSQDHNAVP